VRRRSAMLLASVATAIALSACGSSGLSYQDGYGVGQGLAATAAHGTLEGAGSTRGCAHQWKVSGPASDQRSAWVKGCVAGVRALLATLGE
jgi:hypothetical protein